MKKNVMTYIALTTALITLSACNGNKEKTENTKESTETTEKSSTQSDQKIIKNTDHIIFTETKNYKEIEEKANTHTEDSLVGSEVTINNINYKFNSIEVVDAEYKTTKNKKTYLYINTTFTNLNESLNDENNHIIGYTPGQLTMDVIYFFQKGNENPLASPSDLSSNYAEYYLDEREDIKTLTALKYGESIDFYFIVALDNTNDTVTVESAPTAKFTPDTITSFNKTITLK